MKQKLIQLIIMFLAVAILIYLGVTLLPKKPTTQLSSLNYLSKHVGEYPCRSEMLKRPVFQAALKSILGADYEAYLEHMSFAGCGAIQQDGDYILMDVSQLHVGGYSSLIIIRPKDDVIYLSWLKARVWEKEYQLYGKRPIPKEVIEIIVDNLNGTWGHVAAFSWEKDNLRIDLKDD